VNGVKTIAAGGAHALAALFSPLVQYPVDVTKDLLLIYNTNSADSAVVKDYYLAHRPLVSGANVLGIGYTNSFAPGYYETITPEGVTNQILAPVSSWLQSNPTKRPEYVVLFLDVPSRVYTNTTFPTNGNYPRGITWPSVSLQLQSVAVAWQPLVTHINMDGTNDCIAYINKLASFGTNGNLIISASAGRYSNTNYYFDDCPGEGTEGSQARTGVLNVNPTASVIYTSGDDQGTNLAVHITSGTNVAGYISQGAHSALGGNYALYGEVTWHGNSSWWIIETVESFNGLRFEASQGTFLKWFSSSAFGGVNYANTPIGAVTHVDEPARHYVNNAAVYFGLWEAGKNFSICAWASRQTPVFQAVGDPFVTK
jgi:hypothetical protein